MSAVVIAGCSDSGRRDIVETRLAPHELPGDLELTNVYDHPGRGAPMFLTIFAVPEDIDRGSAVGIMTTHGPDALDAWRRASDDTGAGRERAEPQSFGINSQLRFVSWSETAELVVAALERGLTNEELLQVAHTVKVDERGRLLGDPALPNGFKRALERSELVISSLDVGKTRRGPDRYQLVYWSQRHDGLLTIDVFPTGPDYLTHARFLLRGGELTRIRGMSALVDPPYRGGGSDEFSGLTWREPSGVAVDITAVNVPFDDVLTVAKSVYPATRAEWKAIMRKAA